MRNKLIVAAVLVGAIAGTWRISKEREAKPDLANTEQFISYASDQAVADAQKFDGIALDYSIDSIKNVDTVLGQVHDSYVQNPASIHVNGVAAEYGAYVGEVIQGTNRTRTGLRIARSVKSHIRYIGVRMKPPDCLVLEEDYQWGRRQYLV